ncbi:hypothetical protein CCHR01_02871 [Colletotrichum chrysophilum]|uniref:Uncharacterized protein n=1 Tax=Colletotrichum chrysophilum TaxID=1836956 RepID=A0AAD9EMX8_9PEZI|nr:hypothetical protein CCHR01_02871 [Colletotrichum chrysophilum]
MFVSSAILLHIMSPLVPLSNRFGTLIRGYRSSRLHVRDIPPTTRKMRWSWGAHVLLEVEGNQWTQRKSLTEADSLIIRLGCFRSADKTELCRSNQQTTERACSSCRSVMRFSSNLCNAKGAALCWKTTTTNKSYKTYSQQRSTQGKAKRMEMDCDLAAGWQVPTLSRSKVLCRRPNFCGFCRLPRVNACSLGSLWHLKVGGRPILRLLLWVRFTHAILWVSAFVLGCHRKGEAVAGNYRCAAGWLANDLLDGPDKVHPRCCGYGRLH